MNKVDWSKVRNFVKRPENLLLIGIVLLGAWFRLKYLPVTFDQPLWWDEAEYGATAKHWALGVPYDLNPQRPPLFSLIWAFLIGLGASEQTIKLLIVMIPSIATILITYFLGKEMYSKKVGWIAAFLVSITWSYVFWSARFQPDFISLDFQLLSILFMWRVWKNRENCKLLNPILAGVFAAAAFYFKVSALLVPLSFLIYSLVMERQKIFARKEYYYAGLAFLITLLPLFFWSHSMFGDFLAFRTGYSDETLRPTEFGWYNLGFYKIMTGPVLFWTFLVCLAVSLRFVFYFDLVRTKENTKERATIYSLITLITVSAFYIFYIRGTEDRWVFLWMPFIFFICGDGLLYLKRKISENSKTIGSILLLVLLVSVSFFQYSHFDNLIQQKKESYAPVKLAGIWLKENAGTNKTVSTVSYPQIVYYSERNVSTYSKYSDQTEFFEYLGEVNAGYFIYSIFEPVVFEEGFLWLQDYLINHPEKFEPLKAYPSAEGSENLVLVIYKIK